MTTGTSEKADKAHKRWGELIHEGHFPTTRAFCLRRTYSRDGIQTSYVRFWDISISLKIPPEEEDLQIFSNIIKQLNTEPEIYVETMKTCLSAGYPSVKIAVFHLQNEVSKEYAYKAHTILKDFIKTCMINWIDVLTGDANQSANMMHKHQQFPHYTLSNFTQALRQILANYNDISGDNGINAFLESSSRALDVRASWAERELSDYKP